MENIDQIVQVISTTGFPIAACCALFYLYDKTMNNVTMTLKELTELIRELKKDLERDKEGSVNAV